ncbi:DHH family phosphoesterase [Natronobacterium gregoryi]|uniref:Exopolyphosphatase-like enzyme n=2 Tax=Natronobacterium gregoryi TaxID=44930 RepID=L0AKD9_NATGS|nr:DHH family phosphoesterase [Natronobacterium gregoryi]AFZ74363.1 exopolyphosphatase-like enzyme [Natronobacterium gregoryi SP2]ELY63329.1 phosphoesterase RecJ domain-containing protein [Natronobacterium gregoryi SP2]PLK22128.1 phosphoesterase [Natronobacterium gregoryi SP2]SFI54489.1 nanoRNase/pAp phosphatase, hydrolyzes c-di-AMP and oligoRNAs [Natronobacterium gregoryi]
MSTGVTISSISDYAILGCGSVGYAVAEELVEQGKNVRIIDRDESRVESLRDQDLDARTADIREPDVADLVAERDVILILASDVESNKEAVSHIREENDGQFVVARASDPVSGDELEELGADIVINPSSVIAESALRALESGELEYNAGKLAATLEETANRLAIITKDSPDPDSIAAAAAMQAIADHLGVDSDIIYLGDVGHQENRAFVNLLGIDLVQWSEIEDASDYDTVTMVDHATSGEIDLEVDALIDHSEPEDEYEPGFVDIRPNMSSTSTIMTKYIQEFDMNVSEEVATALLYGIRAETLDFKRDTTPADLTAAAYLYPFANHDTLEQVESPSMSPETLDVLAEAIANRDVQGSHLVSNAGFVRDREALTQAASHLLNLEGVTTTAVFGIADETIFLAGRSKDIRINIGKVLDDAYGDIGETAGHSTQASAEIPLGIFTGIEISEDTRDTLLQLTEEAVKRTLFDAMGVDGAEGSNGN